VEGFVMERTEVLELMATLKLYGMRAAYDEVMTTGIKRRHEPPRIVGDLLSAEIAEKQARSIKYQLTIAKLPLAKDIDEFDFTGASQRGADPRSGNRRLSRRTAQCGADRRNRHWQVASGHSYCASLHPRQRKRALLHRRRPRQPARE
jgi:hypothetical protein